MTKRLFPALALFALVFVLSACSDGSKEVIGAWKTADVLDDLGKPGVLLIEENKLKRDHRFASPQITFKKDGNIILINEVGPGGSFLQFMVMVIDENTIRVRHDLMEHSGFERTYVRTTPEEIQRIKDMPKQRK